MDDNQVIVNCQKWSRELWKSIDLMDGDKVVKTLTFESKHAEITAHANTLPEQAFPEQQKVCVAYLYTLCF